MNLADQASATPSNKVIVFAAMTILMHHFQGMVLPPEVVEAYGVLIQVGLAMFAAYMTPDRPNVPRGEK